MGRGGAAAAVAAAATASWAMLLQSRGAQGAVAEATAPLLGFSTWNYFGCDINETLIEEVAKAMRANGLQAAGYSFINLDDCWAADQRNATTGAIYGDPTRFPSGVRALADKLHALNFSFGLYTARNTRTCADKMPGSLGNERLDAATFADMGADFIKNDDCRVVYADAVKDYAAMQRAIAATGRPMLHNVKAPDLPPLQAPLVAQSRRVGKDLGNDWDDLVRMLDTGSDRRFAAQAGPAGSLAASTLSVSSSSSSNTPAGFFNDFDMLFVGDTFPPSRKTPAPPLTRTEQVAHFSLWAALKSPLVLGNDPRHVSADTLAILSNKDVLAVNQDPLGRQAVRVGPPQRAPGANVTGAKLRLDPCGPDARAALQAWTLPAAGDGNRMRSVADPSLCVVLSGCRTRWPFDMHVQPCSNATGVRDDGRAPRAGRGRIAATCTPQDEESWAIDQANGTWAWAPPTAGLNNGFWGGTNGGCVSAEGANPEVDSCGWAEDVSQQQWAFEPLDANGTAFSVISLQQNLCLTIAADLEVYASLLSTGCATAVLFNRSPVAAPISVRTADLAAELGYQPGARESSLFDLWLDKSVGTTSNGEATATVAPHGVVHYNICPVN